MAMAISLHPETEKLIIERMQRGGYATPDDLVRAGLESLDQQQSAGEFAPGELEELIAEGEAGGPSLDGEKFLTELRQKRAIRTCRAESV